MFKVDYEYYTNIYGGTEIEEAAFPRYQMRSGIELDRLTYGHIKEINGEYGQYINDLFEPFTQEELEYLSFAVCSLMDAVKRLDDYQTQSLAGSNSERNIRTRTSGDESITYESKKTLYDDALTDSNARNKLMRNAVFEVCDPFLFRFNPFYAGLESRWE